MAGLTTVWSPCIVYNARNRFTREACKYACASISLFGTRPAQKCCANIKTKSLHTPGGNCFTSIALGPFHFDYPHELPINVKLGKSMWFFSFRTPMGSHSSLSQGSTDYKPALAKGNLGSACNFSCCLTYSSANYPLQSP